MKKKVLIGLGLFLMLLLGARPTLANDTNPDTSPTLSLEVPLNDSTFPCHFFRQVVTEYDKNQDGKLSQDEIDSVEYLTFIPLSKTEILTNIEGLAYFQNLKQLFIRSSELASLKLPQLPMLEQLVLLDNQHLTALDVTQTTNLNRVRISNNKLKELDFRGMPQLLEIDCQDENLDRIDIRKCPLIQNVHPLNTNTTVLISAGMTFFKGDSSLPHAATNLVIDLDGFYVENQERDKLVDLSKVLSPSLISILEKTHAVNYDAKKQVLTIPSHLKRSNYSIQLQDENELTWFFYPDSEDTSKEIIHFETNGGTPLPDLSLDKGKIIDKPTPPEKNGYTFFGWFRDTELKDIYDFSQPITADHTIYAHWKPEEDNSSAKPSKVTVNFQLDGQAYDEPQLIAIGKLAKRPTTPFNKNADFSGWYWDPELELPFSFSNPIQQDMTLYASWKPYERSENNVVTNNPKKENFFVIAAIGITVGICLALYFRKKLEE